MKYRGIDIEIMRYKKKFMPVLKNQDAELSYPLVDTFEEAEKFAKNEIDRIISIYGEPRNENNKHS